ncbi:MAG TPA: TonB-dependent receptor [Terriglobales bacterium]|nr:TonB-dependent receptor [Terriglobales bacterium]
MRWLRTVSAFLILGSCVWAADLTVKVSDPQAAVVRGARVTLYRSGSQTPIAIQDTSAEGLARFSGIADGTYDIQVLAVGFAPSKLTTNLPGEAALSVILPVTAETRSVVVSASRTPLPEDQSGAQTASLTGSQIQLLNPTAEVDALRFLPGVVVGQNGRTGSLSSLFVRGGNSNYNKVIIDGVTVNEDGGTFDFGVVPTQQMDRLELVRGADSTLYGSDAMTSVVQTWTRTGSTRTPELEFGADGGNFGTANGYASLSGARGRLDYNVFADQFNTQGQGVNDRYGNSSQGANLGVTITPKVFFRFRTRHSNNYTGVQSFWNFNGQPYIPPDTDQRAHQNNFLASSEFTVQSSPHWQHRLWGFEYNHKRTNQDTFMDPGRVSPLFGPIDFPFDSVADLNRAGLEYQGDWSPQSWAHTTVGYRFEDENGFVGDLTALPLSHGLRRNQSVYGQEAVSLGRLSLIAGVRFEHNTSFGNKGVPRVAASYLVRRGNDRLAGTRLRFSYAQGILEPTLEESFGVGGFDIIPNPNLKAEQNRAFEAGFDQSFGTRGRYALSGTYFNNLFTNQIDFSFDPTTFISQYVNVNKALAHGAELEFHARPLTRVSIDGGYTYLSTQILDQPFATDPLLQPGRPLLRRPKHSGNLLVQYLGSRWGGTLGATAVGRRPDSDFEGLLPPVTYAAGYGRVDLGGWYEVTHRVTAYANIFNVTDRKYDEAAGYPALHTNFRAGLRFRVGGD